MPRRSRSEALLEFEIDFYERLLRAYPDFADVLIPLGDAYTRRGLYEKGLAIDLRLTQLRTHDPLAWYNLACSYSLLKRIDEAVGALRRAIEMGYTDVGHLQSDPDLINLRQSPKFRQLFQSVTALPSTRPDEPGPQSA